MPRSRREMVVDREMQPEGSAVVGVKRTRCSNPYRLPGARSTSCQPLFYFLCGPYEFRPEQVQATVGVEIAEVGGNRLPSCLFGLIGFIDPATEIVEMYSVQATFSRSRSA